ncbi:inter-alpha-trypsin inhibitor heavy chain H3 isoform X1 [Misgurnus anguillicaudatus]|uniref:inter-alpha-trypsin inhibitor heavy chain H3 isoform X1 n=1 Tax=Misgurnus anguillicaudatus TaxID=75329 RepID=UPI003CCFDD2A
MDRGVLKVILLAVFLISATSDPVTKTQDVNIYSFYINSTVTSRYATTIITSRVANRLNESQEIFFEVKIPKNAFISKFRMTIDGKSYDGVVKEKADAQQQYSRAVSRGQSAGLIKSVGRTLEEFKTSVNVAALSKVTFELTYEELLKRRLGKYELLINAQPMQAVKDFKINVHIHEKPGISFLELKGDLSTNDLANAIKTTRADKDAWVTFFPTRVQQKSCKNCDKNGLKGDLLITYDVERQNPNGEMTVSNGYFVHNFAPSGLPRISKNVVFIIDRSGSMRGNKIVQTRLALLRILSDLAEDDHFGLITFDSKIKLWKRELLKATEANLEDAKSFVKNIVDRGATDINAAVLEGVKMINRHPQEGTASILILLTDGDPTTGETNTERIMSNVRKAIESKFPLYCLGFGYDVNFDFLTKMSLENNGVARRIYEDSDADLQLQGFYDEVAVPLLTDIQLNYIGVSNLTQNNFALYFNGSEIVVSGQITDNNVESISTEVIAISKGNKVTYHDAVITKDVTDVLPEHEDFMERLWAYLTVKQLLDKQVLLEGPEQEAVKNESLKLSLKYQFVTPLTSMVVTKPQEGDVEVADKPKEGKESHRPSVSSSGSHMIHSGTPSSRVMSSSRVMLQAVPDRTPVLRKLSRVGSHTRLVAPTHVVVSSIQVERHRIYANSPSHNILSSIHPPAILDRTAEFQTKGDIPLDAPIWTGVCKEDDILFYSQRSVDHTFRFAAGENSNRFLLAADGQSKPLCFDVLLHHKLRLLEDSSREFYMNGESQTTKTGFSKIAFHYKKSHNLTITTNSISYRNDQDNIDLLWGQNFTLSYTDGVDLIITCNKINVSMGDFSVSVLLHKNDGGVYLWPAVQQYPQDGSLTGIFGKYNISYEKAHEFNNPTLKIMDKNVNATWVHLKDSTKHSIPNVHCWLVSFDDVMNRKISDFIVTQI